MIAVRLEGRLGNQLFQYAFIYSRAKALRTKFYVDKSLVPFFVPQYFEVPTDKTYWIDKTIFKIKGFKNIFSYHLKKKFYQKSANVYGLKHVSFNDIEAAPAEVLTEVRDKTLISGFFQSAEYFSGFENEIRKIFTIRPKFRQEFNEKHGRLYQNNYVVCVHIRRTDYLQLGHLDFGGADLSLPLAYYKAAIDTFQDKNVLYVFIGDDHRFINENFAYISNKIIANDSEIVDFQHLINADACIISNSTFSWWGAWLNNRGQKVIYAPRYFMGWRLKREIPLQVYPQNWVQIEF